MSACLLMIYFRIRTSKKEKMSLGFIILRHVNSARTDLYWQECHDSIRRLYPEETIMIIDDNSNEEFLTTTKDLDNTILIRSEFPGRAEILPYYYFLKNKMCETAIFLHDSVFLRSRFPDEYITSPDFRYIPLWHFHHDFTDPEGERNFLYHCFDKERADFLAKMHADRETWIPCFGVMTIITHDFLTKIDEHYDIARLMKIRNRKDREHLERIMACIFASLHRPTQPSLFGDILSFMPWGVTFEERHAYEHLPIINALTNATSLLLSEKKCVHKNWLSHHRRMVAIECIFPVIVMTIPIGMDPNSAR